VITQLGVGEALASTLDEKGTPSMVQRVRVAPPGSRLGSITPAERAELMAGSLVKGIYDDPVDRVSAYEILQQRAEVAAEVAAAAAAAEPGPRSSSGSRRQSPLEAFVASAARSIGTQIGRSLMRGIMGSLSGGRRRR
jgi:hypothetical protein